MLTSLLATPPPAYRIVDLGEPPQAKEVVAVAINDRGEVLVRSPVYPTGKNAKGELTFRKGHGYLWRAGRFLDFGEPKPSRFFDPPDAVPTALNNLSVAVGTEGTGAAVFMSGLVDVNPFIWRGKGMDDLGSGWSSIPRSINNLGDIVGEGNNRAFARLKGRLMWLPTISHVVPSDPGGEMNDVNHEEAVSVNDRRQILYNATYDPPAKGGIVYERPFVLDGNSPHARPQPVPLPDGLHEARGLALNDAGTILMMAGSTLEGVRLYFVRRGRVVPLWTSSRFLACDRAAMNRHEDVVATVGDATPNASHPALWLQGRELPYPRFPDWTLQTAVGINDKGQICGTGLHDGKTRAYVLTPSSPPNRPAGRSRAG